MGGLRRARRTALPASFDPTGRFAQPTNERDISICRPAAKGDGLALPTRGGGGPHTGGRANGRRRFGAFVLGSY